MRDTSAFMEQINKKIIFMKRGVVSLQIVWGFTILIFLYSISCSKFQGQIILN